MRWTRKRVFFHYNQGSKKNAQHFPSSDKKYLGNKRIELKSNHFLSTIKVSRCQKSKERQTL